MARSCCRFRCEMRADVLWFQPCRATTLQAYHTIEILLPTTFVAEFPALRISFEMLNWGCAKRALQLRMDNTPEKRKLGRTWRGPLRSFASVPWWIVPQNATPLPIVSDMTYQVDIISMSWATQNIISFLAGEGRRPPEDMAQSSSSQRPSAMSTSKKHGLHGGSSERIRMRRKVRCNLNDSARVVHLGTNSYWL